MEGDPETDRTEGEVAGPTALCKTPALAAWEMRTAFLQPAGLSIRDDWTVLEIGSDRSAARPPVAILCVTPASQSCGSYKTAMYGWAMGPAQKCQVKEKQGGRGLLGGLTSGRYDTLL